MDRSTNSSTGSLSADQSRSGPSESSRLHSTTSADAQLSKQSSRGSSASHSAHASRESSPTRPQVRSSSSTSNKPIPGTPKSRTNSQQDLSPSRTPKSNIPIPPPSSKTLSAATTPTLLPASHEQASKTNGPQKASLAVDTYQSRDSPRWPVSPRLRSPPPQLSRPGLSPRRNEADASRANFQRATSASEEDGAFAMSESEAEESVPQSGVRTPALGSASTLETVQEVSQPSSPGQVDTALDLVSEKLSGEANVVPVGHDHQPLVAENKDLKSVKATSTAVDSGSENSSARTDPKRSPGTAPTPTIARQPSALSTKQAKSKTAGEGSAQSMIVETETVASIPQVALAPGSKAEGANGTLKTKPSTETIKPKKEKKKSGRKQPAVTQGAASSKADIFEAKVASAVDEADTSDSEETFVYDSNPPDGGDRPRRFHHSRTPSATSMVSQADRNAMRSIHSVMEGCGPPVVAKKGMKFVNSFTGNGGEGLVPGDDDGKGSGRSAGPGSGRGTARHHHHNHLTHIGRWGRNGTNSHTSLFDNESPFPNATRWSKVSGNNSRQSSGPPSPRVANVPRSVPNSAKKASMQGHSYDLDDTTGADDERTPLIAPSVRSARNRNRRHPANPRNLESQAYRQKPSYLNRFAACLVVTMMLLLVITGAIGFMFATSQPLTDIELVSIKNVLASDPELMFDLTVKAHNPNIVVVTIDQANVEVFAKSIHAGTDSDWWKWPHGPEGRKGHDDTDSDIHIEDDPPDDPPDDDAAPNMRLGAITELDSPLSFEGSFFNKGVSSSTGEMRLGLPGNHSAGGSERWGRIIQDEFDLILKGVVRYSLPLSQRVRSAPISGRATVKPNSADDPSRNSTLEWDVSEMT